jgi:hypothetical protein
MTQNTELVEYPFEREFALELRNGSVLFTTQDPNERRIPGHVLVRIYVGPDAESRRPVGSMVVRDEEVGLLDELAAFADLW